ncbi:MAG: hypothetical protein JSU01_06790 [Bacteroidetes bacterium]|nr:hypothetical protein [Bacteroidota bacterium]
MFTYRDYVMSFLAYGSGPPKTPTCGEWWTGKHNLTDELIITLLIVGFFFIAFSRLKNESKVTIGLRALALYWAVLVNGSLIFIDFLLMLIAETFHVSIHFTIDLFDMQIYSCTFIFWLIFIFRFRYLIYQDKRNKLIGLLRLLPYKPYYVISGILSVAFILFLVVVRLIPKIEVSENVFFGCFSFFLLWIWSKAKNETTDISSVRMKSMHIAVYINFGLVLLETWAMYGGVYWEVQLLNIISVPIIFAIVFYYMRYKHRLKIHVASA